MRKTPFFLPFLFIFLLIISLYNLNIKLWGESSKLISIEGKKVEIIGVVERVKKKKDDYTGYEVKALKLIKGKNTLELNENIFLSFSGEDGFDIGDIIKFRSVVKVPEENTNHGLFNYQRYLKSSKIYTIFTANEGEIEKIGRDRKLGYALKRNFRNYVEKALYGNLEEDNASLLSSVILADYNYLEDEVLEDYRKLGLSHLLAVSGLHISIIVVLFIFFLSKLGVKRGPLSLITMGFLWIYAYIIGFPSSVVRGGIMTSLMLIAFLLKEPYSMENSCLLAGLIILLLNPYDLFNAGFQLSFGATLSIAYLTKPLKNLLYPRKSLLVDGLYVNLAVQLGLFPIIIYHFSYFNLVNILTNLIITPIFTLTLWLVALLLLTFPVLSSFNPLGILVNFLTNIMETWNDIFGIGSFIGRNFRLPGFYSIFLYYSIIGIFLFLRKYRSYFLYRGKAFIRFVVLILFMNLLFFVFFTDREVISINMIDVGQGDSIFIESYGKKILIDTGGSHFKADAIAKRVTVPYLKKKGLNKLDALVLSHYDGDHAGGTSEILKEFHVSSIFIPYVSDSKYFDIIKESGVETYISKPGGILKVSDNSSLTTIFPDGDKLPEYKRKGNLSSVQILKHFNNTMLFTGDMEKEDEGKILDLLQPVDVLKVGHHGSDTSSTRAFIEKINPRISLISVGRKNTYGHPSKDVLERLEEAGSVILRTDKEGEINLTFTEGGIYYSSYKSSEVNLEWIFYFLIATVIIFFMMGKYIEGENYGLQGFH